MKIVGRSVVTPGDVDSDGGGNTWATIATLLQTARMNDVDPFAWLARTLQRIAGGWSNQDLDQLLPFNHHAD